MKSIFKNLLLLFFITGIASCKNGNAKYDATGTFEAEEIIVSAEATGRILQFNVEEGVNLVKDSVVGKIDPAAIELQKEQASSSVDALQQKTNDDACSFCNSMAPGSILPTTESFTRLAPSSTFNCSKKQMTHLPR